MNPKRLLPVLLVLAAMTAAPALAQKSPWWVGLELGEPTAVTLLRDRASGPDFELLAAWDLENFIFLSGHLLYEGKENLGGRLTWFYGPGLFIGARDNDGDDDTAIGASGRVGVNLGFEAFRIYVALTPRFEVLPSTSFDLGGGLGFRFKL